MLLGRCSEAMSSRGAAEEDTAGGATLGDIGCCLCLDLGEVCESMKPPPPTPPPTLELRLVGGILSLEPMEGGTLLTP